MSKRLSVDIAVLSRFIRYCRHTGRLEWIEHLHDAPHWYARVAGTPAFCTRDQDGYLTGVFQGASMRAHHVAYALMTGEWLDGQIDHANGDRADNRWLNLRPAGSKGNGRNRGPKAGKRYVGTTWNAQQREWRANIQIDGKKVFLGAFPSEEEAAAAYDRAALARSPQFVRLNFPERRHEYASDTSPVGRGRNSGLLAA